MRVYLAPGKWGRGPIGLGFALNDRRGLHSYACSLASDKRAPMPRRVRVPCKAHLRVRHGLKCAASYEAAQVSQDRRHGVGIGTDCSPVRSLLIASAAARSRSAACCWLIGSQMNMTMLS